MYLIPMIPVIIEIVSKLSIAAVKSDLVSTLFVTIETYRERWWSK
jgi:hypothetical protein